ncbi:MAG: hypothetical protein ACRC0L_09385, partial [Angustibacter sp.]
MLRPGTWSEFSFQAPEPAFAYSPQDDFVLDPSTTEPSATDPSATGTAGPSTTNPSRSELAENFDFPKLGPADPYVAEGLFGRDPDQAGLRPYIPHQTDLLPQRTAPWLPINPDLPPGVSPTHEYFFAGQRLYAGIEVLQGLWQQSGKNPQILTELLPAFAPLAAELNSQVPASALAVLNDFPQGTFRTAVTDFLQNGTLPTDPLPATSQRAALLPAMANHLGQSARQQELLNDIIGREHSDQATVDPSQRYIDRIELPQIWQNTNAAKASLFQAVQDYLDVASPSTDAPVAALPFDGPPSNPLYRALWLPAEAPETVQLPRPPDPPRPPGLDPGPPPPTQAPVSIVADRQALAPLPGEPALFFGADEFSFDTEGDPIFAGERDATQLDAAAQPESTELGAAAQPESTQLGTASQLDPTQPESIQP